jgi:hypothetical protein
MADNTTPKQRGGFAPGQSGNPAGRPKGARNKATLAVEALLVGEAEARRCTLLSRSRARMGLCRKMRHGPPCASWRWPPVVGAAAPGNTWQHTKGRK